MKYALIILAVLAFFSLLRFVEGSPVRSWKTVLGLTLPISALICFYSYKVFAPVPPAPQAQKVSAYRAELERNFRRIAGVSEARIAGTNIYINFAVEKPLAEIKQIALSTCATAASFLKMDRGNTMTIHMTVRGYQRYEMSYDTEREH